jgi:hypothetical protein
MMGVPFGREKESGTRVCTVPTLLLDKSRPVHVGRCLRRHQQCWQGQGGVGSLRGIGGQGGASFRREMQAVNEGKLELGFALCANLDESRPCGLGGV